MEVSRHSFLATNSSGDVSGILMRPADATCLYLFAHGAGAGMEHAFMEAAAGQLAERGVASFRYNFPYKERGAGFRPDPPRVLEATVRSAVAAAGREAGGLPMIADDMVRFVREDGGALTVRRARLVPESYGELTQAGFRGRAEAVQAGVWARAVPPRRPFESGRGGRSTPGRPTH